VRNVKLCAGRQRQIIGDIFPALKPGGILIYSTCTYNREENEDNIDRICTEFEMELLEKPHRFMPHQTKGEGFFIAALRKNFSRSLSFLPLVRGCASRRLFRQVEPVGRA
jgi:16S rRNA C967 or C1407 C5-methylase (RsmB/RsmF family)